MSSAEGMAGLVQSSITGENPSRAHRLGLLILNCSLLVLGCAASFFSRIYFLHGGKRMWLSSLVQIAGWPLLLIPLSICYARRSRRIGRWDPRVFQISPFLFVASAVIGVLSGLDCYLFAFSSAYLPVSTASLLASTQTAFIAVFAFFMVKLKLTPYSINSVVVLTLGAVILGIQPGIDRPAGESNSHYFLGFIMTIAAAALYAFTFPLTELMYMKAKQEITYSLVMEMQMVLAVFGSGVCVVGMVVNKDFQAIAREAREFGLGEVKYYVVLLLGVFFWQTFNLGFMGTIACSSSLFTGIVLATLLPVTVIGGVLFFHENFDGAKGVCLVLCLWGFASYLYGEWKLSKKIEQTAETMVLRTP